MNYKDASLPIAERLSDLLGRMTLEEKVAQLVQTFISPENRSRSVEFIRRAGLGSRLLSESNLSGNIEQRTLQLDEMNAIQRVAVEETRLGIPILHGRDIIHGHRTIFPIPLAMAATFDPGAVEQAFTIAGREASDSGIHWSFAPMLDIARDPRWGRIIEGFGEDPHLASIMAAAAVHGFQGRARPGEPFEPGRILACAKHYLGYGAAEGGRDYNTAEITPNTLRNIYLPPFRAAVEAGVGSVMSAFEDLDGEPITGSRSLLTGLLKEELGFEGFIVSDWGSVEELAIHRVAADKRQAALLAIQAGLDMEMVSDCFSLHLAGLVREGLVSPERLDDAVRRVLLAKFRLGLFEHPYTSAGDFNRPQFTPESQAAARRTAARGMVLLKNDGLLPLETSPRKIAVLGPLADVRRPLLGSWVIEAREEGTPTLVEAVRSACPEAEVLTNPSGLADELLMTASRADVVILAVGESHARTGEANCIASLELPPGQEALVEAIAALGHPLVLVVFSGRPLVLTRLVPQVGALLQAWHPGSLGAAPVADLLFGLENPSGRLPVTFPRYTGQVPIHYNHKSTGRPWLRYIDMPTGPLFPFGFGLSYTTFAYSGLAASPAEVPPGGTVTLSVTVTNTGSRPGEEVAQCYLQDVVSALTRPVRELKAFQRVLLQPGEARRVEFVLGPRELSYYGPGGKWVLEPGEFKAWVGSDSTASLEASFRVL